MREEQLDSAQVDRLRYLFDHAELIVFQSYLFQPPGPAPCEHNLYNTIQLIMTELENS